VAGTAIVGSEQLLSFGDSVGITFIRIADLNVDRDLTAGNNGTLGRRGEGGALRRFGAELPLLALTPCNKEQRGAYT
jgi:hypothetical protein